MHDADPFRRAGGSLQLIFWGTLLVLLDFSFTFREGATGFSCDVLHDAAGYLMIALGLKGLIPLVIHPTAARIIKRCLWVAVLSVPAALSESVLFSRAAPLRLAESMIGLAQVVGMCVFCVAMYLITRQRQMRVANLWHVTSLLIVGAFVIPYGFLYGANLLGILTGQTFHVNPPSSMVVGAAVALLATVIVLLVAIAKTRNELRRPPPSSGTYDPRGFDVIVD